MKDWIYKHDLLELSNSLGKYLGGYCEFCPENGEVVDFPPPQFCATCQEVHKVILPTKEFREKFREQLISALRGAPSNIAPSLKHFWYHARCSKCGADLILMRS
jgi:hypothetical protein